MKKHARAISLDSWHGFETIALYGSTHERISERSKIPFSRGADDLDDTWEVALRLPSGRKVALVQHINSPQVAISIMFAGQRPVVPDVIRETLDVLQLHPRRLLWTVVPIDTSEGIGRSSSVHRKASGSARSAKASKTGLARLKRLSLKCRKGARKLRALAAWS
jgi:hypothetical protein